MEPRYGSKHISIKFKPFENIITYYYSSQSESLYILPLVGLVLFTTIGNKIYTVKIYRL